MAQQRGNKEPLQKTIQSASPIASWIFGSILIVFLIASVFFIKEPSAFQCGVVRFLMSLTAALFAFFFVGGVVLKGKLRDLAISATGGFVLFILMQFVYDPLGPQCSASGKGPTISEFSQAVKQLDNPDISARVAGIYALEQIAKNSKSEHWKVMELLTTYVRNHAKWDQRNQQESHPLSEDLRAVIKVLSERTWAYEDGPNQIIDLSNTDLQGQADFTRAYLVRSTFNKSNLKDALFINADLSGAYLTDSVLVLARFYDAKLTGTNFAGSDLTGATFRKAKAQNASFSNAELSGSNFFEADLTNTNFSGANIANADFKSASGLTVQQVKAARNFNKAKLPETLQSAILTGGN